MAITHAKVSAKADGGDSTVVLPSDWNAAHVGTATPAAHNHAWSDLNSGVPTTISGYGITDSIDKGYVILGGGDKFSPADNTTYYFGAFPGLAPSVVADVRRLYIPKTGTIKVVQIFVYTNGTNGSADNTTITLIVNNTGAGTTITATLTMANDSEYRAKTDCNIAVTVGDYIEFKWTSPANYTTNPTNVYISAIVYIE